MDAPVIIWPCIKIDKPLGSLVCARQLRFAAFSNRRQPKTVVIDLFQFVGNSAPVFDASAYPPGYPHTAYFDEGTATASGTTIHTFTVTDPEGQPFSMSYSYSPFGSEEMFTITGKKYSLSQGIPMRRFF